MKMRYLFVLPVAVALWACSSDEPAVEDPIKDNPRQYISLSRGEEQIVASQNDFAFRLFSKAMNDGNNVISPLSVSMAMSMTANGAVGETYDEICAALGFDRANIDEVNSLNRTLIENLPVVDKRTTLSIANSMWMDSELQVLDSFKSSMMDVYDAPADNVSFSDMAGINKINSWVSEKTGGKICNLLEGPMDCNVALVNAIYFKSIWRFPFSKSSTKREPFRNETGEKVRVNMMHSPYKHRAIQDDDVTIARMDYGNEAFCFTAILPPEDVKVADFANGLTGVKWQEWCRFFDSIDITNHNSIAIPKFTQTCSFDLIPTLKTLGIKSAFIKNVADLSKLTPSPYAHVKFVIQKATIEVDEEGVVAAASTGSHVKGLTMSAMQGEEVVFDRPFLYIISEKSTGAILFIGDVTKLEQV